MKTIELKGEKQRLKKSLFALAELDITVSVVDAPPTTCLTACSGQRPQPVSSSSGPHYRHHHHFYRREVQQQITRQRVVHNRIRRQNVPTTKCPTALCTSPAT